MDVFRFRLGMVFILAAISPVSLTPIFAQNFERYAPRDFSLPRNLPSDSPDLPQEDLPDVSGDDRVLVEALDAVVIVDSAKKIQAGDRIDELTGIHYDFEAKDSIVFQCGIRHLIEQQIGEPITLRRLNTLARDIVQQYRRFKMPIVDVQIPEQRITGGTVYFVVVETRIDQVRVQPGCYFDCCEVARWIQCTRQGDRVFEPALENDLFWMNQNPFRRVSVDFQKGARDGTTDVIYRVNDIRPIRGYLGVDDSGVETLNLGRFFTGLSYGNVFGKGGTLGYQYTTDEDFALLKAHSASFTQPINRCWSIQAFGSWAGVTPSLGGGLNQEGESWQLGASVVRHLERTRYQMTNINIGVDFKSTNNNLEFSGQTVAASNADLFQLRFGIDRLVRGCCPDEYVFAQLDAFVGPGGGMTGSHSAAAFDTIRPGATPDYVYGRLLFEDSRVIRRRLQLVSRFAAQAASERLLFSETLGLGGYDSLRGFDQRAYNADHGWRANFELGPCTYRWGCDGDRRTLRVYSFFDLGNGYLDDPLPGEDSSTFAASTGIGARFQLSDRLVCRFDYGFGVEDLDGIVRGDRAHLGLTWIPGPRP